MFVLKFEVVNNCQRAMSNLVVIFQIENCCSSTPEIHTCEFLILVDGWAAAVGFSDWWKSWYCDELALYDDAGVTCEETQTRRPQSMVDGFEAGILPSHWSAVDGGLVGNGCGTLLPVGHGKSLYFDGCGRRQAVTAELDLTKAGYPLTSLTSLVFFSYLCCLCLVLHYSMLIVSDRNSIRPGRISDPTIFTPRSLRS